MAGIIGVTRAETPSQKPPIHRPRQLRQWMFHVDDLIESGAKQILLARLPPFPWPHPVPLQKPRYDRESQIKFARNPLSNGRYPANSISTDNRFTILNHRLGLSSRTTNNRQRIANAREKPIKANKNQAVDGAEGLFLGSGSPQNVYLLPQHPDFHLERCPRPKQICDHPNNEPDKISHPERASPDSRSTASQIEFAIGTTSLSGS